MSIIKFKIAVIATKRGFDLTMDDFYFYATDNPYYIPEFILIDDNLEKIKGNYFNSFMVHYSARELRTPTKELINIIKGRLAPYLGDNRIAKITEKVKIVTRRLDKNLDRLDEK